MPRWRRLYYALNTRFCQCLPLPCMFVVGSHCIFVTSGDLSISTRFNFSDTPVSTIIQYSRHELGTKFWITSASLSPAQQVALLMVRRKRIPNKRHRSCWVRPWLSEVRRLQFGHYDRLLTELRMEDQQIFKFVRTPQDDLPSPRPLFCGIF